MFSKIVPAFTPQNIDNLGVLVAVAFIYEAIGFLFAWLVKQFFWVPHRFRYGILCAGTISNYSDIPTAVITSITANIPFDASTDQTISVAYVAGFIFVFFISLFPLGAHRLVAMDYDGPNIEDEDLRISMTKKTKQSADRIVRVLHAVTLPGKTHKSADSSSDIEKFPIEADKIPSAKTVDPNVDAALSNLAAQPQKQQQHKSDTTPGSEISASSRAGAVHFHADESTATPTEAGHSRAASPVPAVAARARFADSPNPEVPAPTQSPTRAKILGIARSASRSLLMPCSVTIVFSIVIAVVTPLKALFTPVPNSPIPNAPDGQPPLAFILDCATFVGAASVPLGLICLGSAVARVQLPQRGEWGKLPLGAIISFAVTKMLVLPVLGVLIIQGLVGVGFIDREDKVLRFVCMFISCVPTATSQVYLTQVYSGTGEAGVLPLFLVPQYILMFLSMTILIAYSISILF
ncbi:hypothetical protein EW145_g5341 [Phellinidium pouzarii]|uniref:Auxin efflux carrier n=1 Tax=Phellinidium pouzarii TaxID=167371 RepID=A0A4S4L0A3_9AGAM|nr:hypothetical protein EW145_g5341 [Phellinidium pouzarii]